MLLLVLILVLIAFSLLVVALLSGSVLWAWVSVGVSVAAAAVLLIDYLQRRSAVKAGAQVGAQVGAVSAPPRTGSADMEPVTEVLPVIPRPDAPAAGDEAMNGSQQDATALFDQRADSQQTVAMPIVQPSASTDRPSGASHGITSSGGDSSLTVTTGGPGRSPSGPRSGEADDPPAAPDGGAGAAPESPATEKAATGAGADADFAVDGKGGPPEASSPAQEPAAKEAGATSAAGAPGEVAGESDGAAADADPPEEPHDPAAAAVVAGLDNEVLVIDEQPRYHVPGCRALVGRALIPLPVCEAVELGFTPCSWCSPNRTLAARHAPAR